MEEAITNHYECILAMLRRCRERNLKLNAEKLLLRKTEVPFVGNILSGEGLRMQPTKGDAIIGMETLAGPAAVRRFLGMANNVSRLVPNLAEMATPLPQLTHKDVEWK